MNKSQFDAFINLLSNFYLVEQQSYGDSPGISLSDKQTNGKQLHCGFFWDTTGEVRSYHTITGDYAYWFANLALLPRRGTEPFRTFDIADLLLRLYEVAKLCWNTEVVEDAEE